MIRSSLRWIGAALLLAGAAACLSAPDAPAETPPDSTDTVAAPVAPSPTPAAPTLTVPTSTPPPTAPPPGNTAAAASTPDPDLGAGAVIFQDPLDGRSGWDWSLNDGNALFTVGGGQLTASMRLPAIGARSRLGPNVAIGDQRVQVTARAHLCYARDEYGFLFRATEAGGYLFKLSCEGMVRAERVQAGQSDVVLFDWTAHPAVVARAPAENTLLVWAAGAQFHFFVNGQHVASAQDPTFAAGTYGFYLRDRTAGGMSVSFLQLAAQEVRLP